MIKLSERRRRDATEIKYQILMSAVSGNKKTHIMYESGLNLKQLNHYLGELLGNGALEFRPQKKEYFITEKGRTFARAVDNYRETVALLNKQEATLAQFFPTTVTSSKKRLVAPQGSRFLPSG
jgi:predicted transcriptional regulator